MAVEDRKEMVVNAEINLSVFEALERVDPPSCRSRAGLCIDTDKPSDMEPGLGTMKLSLYNVHAFLILDLEGHRVLAKYHRPKSHPRGEPLEDSPPSDATLHLWDDVGTWLRNKRENSAQSQLIARFTCTQGSRPRSRPTARQEVAPRAPPSAVPASTAYSRDWGYEPFAALPSMSSSSAASNLAVKEEILSSSFQYNIPSSVHAQYSARGVANSQLTRKWQDAIRRMASGSHHDDHHLQPHRPPTCQPSTRPAPYTTSSDSPPRIQRVYQQQRRHWQRAETPMSTSLFDAGPSIQPLQYFPRDAGARMEGRPRTARRQHPEPESPASSMSPEP
ncbi:hypothetical protein FIBSPDRAFT_936600 [Athelia psychrophila]|uniref:Uncharacterized protein n=1 Tax=Athelia psychrophila TaxID=1759441 RepID=A0A166BUI7_9AGAM|nr:hypothetical protein FIBSPDRAFT_936600 [Fibularhizoctonia sp. CBS 109695]